MWQVRKSFFGVKASFRTRKRNNWGIFKREEKGNFRACALKTPLDFVSVALASRQKPADFSCWRVLLHRDQRPDTGKHVHIPDRPRLSPADRASVVCEADRFPSLAYMGQKVWSSFCKKEELSSTVTLKGPLLPLCWQKSWHCSRV